MVPIQTAVRAMRLLIADPDEASHQPLRRRLLTEGWRQVDVVTECAAAIGLLGAGLTSGRPYDLLCLSLRLPDRDGLETLDEVRSLFDVPVLIVADLANRPIAVETLVHGASDYTLRPFDLPLVVFKIEKILTERFLNRELLRSNTRNETLFLNVLAVMAKVLEAKDPNTRAHSEKVSRLGSAMGREAGLTEDEIRSLGIAGVLHDLGKMGIQESILMKPGSLNAEEREVVQRHPMIAGTLLEPIERLGDALPAIRYHHEAFDGKGYPEGRKGEDIPFTARILHVAEAYDVMTTARPYAPTKTPEEAVAELHDKAGAQFDPYAVRCLLPILKEGRSLKRRRASGDSIRTMISDLSLPTDDLPDK
jgi:HD-GYP domain-containing protein (c-di-GMP phosphodiesterase class II)